MMKFESVIAGSTRMGLVLLVCGVLVTLGCASASEEGDEPAEEDAHSLDQGDGTQEGRGGDSSNTPDPQIESTCRDACEPLGAGEACVSACVDEAENGGEQGAGGGDDGASAADCGSHNRGL